MNYDQFLERVINDGVEAAKADYTKPRQQPHLHGSVAGFEACRYKTPVQLAVLLQEAETATRESRHAKDEPDTYWFKRCYELEIEWVCNVVSAMLHNQGQTVIVPVTARGMMKAAEIVGVRT
jgi:hypothetical protein